MTTETLADTRYVPTMDDVRAEILATIDRDIDACHAYVMGALRIIVQWAEYCGTIRAAHDFATAEGQPVRIVAPGVKARARKVNGIEPIILPADPANVDYATVATIRNRMLTLARVAGALSRCAPSKARGAALDQADRAADAILSAARNVDPDLWHAFIGETPDGREQRTGIVTSGLSLGVQDKDGTTWEDSSSMPSENGGKGRCQTGLLQHIVLQDLYFYF